MGGAWAGLWVAVLPHKGHKGHKGHKPAAGKPQGPQASLKPAAGKPQASLKPARGKRWRAGGVLGLLSYQPQADP